MMMTNGDAPRAEKTPSGPRVALIIFALLFSMVVAGDALAQLHNAGRPIGGILGRALSTALLVTVVAWVMRLKRPG